MGLLQPIQRDWASITFLVLVTRSKVKTFYKQQISLTQGNNQTNLDVWNTTLGYGFYFQRRNPRTLPIESFVHDNGHNLVSAASIRPKGSLNTNS
jgi:hypothetical protein